MQLSREQQDIVHHSSGHALVVAAPGSGKTTTLAHRIVHLLSNGAAPDSITVLMFGRDARQEFQAKLAAIAPQGQRLPDIRTLHSVAYATVNLLTNRGMLPNYRLETSDKALELLAMAALKQTLGQEKYKGYQDRDTKIVETLMGFIGLCKACLDDPAVVFDRYAFPDKLKFLVRAYETFESLRHQRQIRSYDDLLLDLVKLIQENNKVAAWIGNNKDHVIIDEFQDISPVQFALLQAIAGDRAQVMAVGDEDQSIYEFRGATPDIMNQQFETEFSGTQVYALSATFRYGHELSLMANHLIHNNKTRKDMLVTSAQGTPATRVQVDMLHSEARWILSVIRRYLDEGRTVDEIAILARTYSATVAVELELLRNNLPYRMMGSGGALATREIKTLILILRLADGSLFDFPQSALQEACRDILRFPLLALKGPMIDKVCQLAAKPGGDRSLNRALRAPRYQELSKFQLKKVLERCELLDYVESRPAHKTGAYELLSFYVKDSELRDSIRRTALTSQESSESIARIDAFLSYIKENNGSVTETLEQLDQLMTSKRESNESSGITLCSIHKAKGLEWPIVFIPALEEKKFPFEPDAEHFIDHGEEAERRLLYVGMTRAKERLHLCAPEDPGLKRYLEEGVRSADDKTTRASRFLFESGQLFSRELAQSLYSKNAKPPQKQSAISLRYLKLAR